MLWLKCPLGAVSMFGRCLFLCVCSHLIQSTCSPRYNIRQLHARIACSCYPSFVFLCLILYSVLSWLLACCVCVVLRGFSFCLFACLPACHLSACLPACMPACLPASLCVSLSVSLSCPALFACLFVCSFVDVCCLSIRLSVCPSVRPSVCPSVRPSVCPSVCLCVCVGVYVFV